ncbi:MAG: hypothetical protein H6617_09740 [Bdellovibrionaceae bacterium]|nr:hypothetical protein [Bdellovibrionales bacterium]MCB9254951.1 hypothetical protein [Pseudobdellovibrionaceae bacterium]
MIRTLVSVLSLVIGLTLSFNAFAKKSEKPAEKDAHAVSSTTKGKKKSRVQADDQKSPVSDLNYGKINDCLTLAGVQWKGMKFDPKTGEYVLEGPRKNGAPEFYLLMGKNSLYRIDTKDLKKDSLLHVKLGDKQRNMTWGRKDGLWLQPNEQTAIPDRFKGLKPVEYDAKVQQYDKLVRSLVGKPVQKHYQAGIGQTIANAGTVVAESRRPMPEILGEVEKMNALIAKYKTQEAQLNSELQSGALSQADFDSRNRLGTSLININQAGIKALSALQAQRETQPYTVSEKLMAYKAVDAQLDASPLKAGYGACQTLLGNNVSKLFPKEDPYGVANYTRLRLMGSSL